MLRSCRVCDSKYDYCPSCALVKNPFKNAGYCGEDCYHISMILQKHRGRRATAKETVESLKPYNIESKQLKPGIQAHYQQILDSITEEVVPTEDVEVVVKNDEDTTIS